MIELLSPVGDFDCLKAAVQNGADSVYFGADKFSARAFAPNFNLDELQKSIIYAKSRGVKTYLTVNTLIKNTEFQSSLNLVKKAYEFGIDAIIVQDLGLGKTLIDNFPNLNIHASTQMSIHNLQGVLELENLGFKRVVLSRELSISEIEYICKHSKIEIECFIHGALCVSYSGQCLFSSLVGGRSGNRGKCAQPCRLPYQVIENDKQIDSGYLLSTRDLCGIDYIPNLIKCGVHSLKIEGRMKSPEYVATVTKIYKKYINLVLSDNPYLVKQEDRKELLQVFNRGMSCAGHLDNKPNQNLIYPEKPNNMGLFLGIVQNYSKGKYITVKLKETINVGDTIALEKESGSYTISELMRNEANIKQGEIGETVVFGRMKGKISPGDKIYKMSSKSQLISAKESFKNENKKILLNCSVTIKKGENISISITSASNLLLYKQLNISCQINATPIDAKNYPLTKEKIIEQINKTTSTQFSFKKISVQLDKNVFLPKLSSLNELRRTALEKVEFYALSHIKRTSPIIKTPKEISNLAKTTSIFNLPFNNAKNFNDKKISVLLNILNIEFDYSKLTNIDNIYIPLKYFLNKKYENTLKILNSKFNMYIYLPTIIKANYRNLILEYINNSIKKYNIQGFVFSNISNLLLLKDLFVQNKFKFIANYTFNVFNYVSIKELKNLGLNSFTLSPELDKKSIIDLCSSTILQKELIVYGNIPIMNMNYCLLGKSNKCYPDCLTRCTSSNKYYLKDRLNMKFRIIPDNIQTVTTLYNSKTTSINYIEFSTDTLRIDILDENILEINSIIETIKKGRKLEGKQFTNGNLNKKV